MFSQTSLNEKISVIAKFKGGAISPLLFKFHDRTYKIKSIDLKYHFRQGGVDYYSFSVSASGNSYKITFDCKDLEWRLEEIWA